MIIAMPAEAALVTGQRGWRTGNGCLRRRETLPGGVELAIGLSGMGPERCRIAARRLIDEGASALIHLGVSGGLALQLRPGELVIADSVMLIDEGLAQNRWQTDGEIAREARERLAARQVFAALGLIASSPRPILSSAMKKECAEEFQALAVDMESAGVTMAVEESGLPCLMLRAVCDAANHSVPVWLFEALNGDGSVRFAHLAGGLVRRPAAVAELLRMRLRFRTACLALREAWNILRASDFPSLLAGRAARL